MQEPFDFTVSQRFPEVLYWFRDKLQLMCDLDLLDIRGFTLQSEGPRTKKLPELDGDTRSTEIVVTGFRIEGPPAPPGSKPEPLGTVMWFEFASIGDSTRIWAHCTERYVAMQALFQDFLRQIEEHYPTVGPLCHQYRARLEQQHIERIERHLMMKAAGVPTAVAGALEMEVSDASAAAQFPPTHGTGAVAAEASGPPTTIDPDDSEIRERKRQIMELWRAGWKRCDAAQKLALSESTVKRYSKELGIDWRIPRAKR